jgi:hypothetical protein
MKRIIKKRRSVIVVNGYTYPDNSALIRAELDNEQNNLCAYTEEYLSPGYSRDVEHFNPTLKKTPRDGYKNWFSASSLINSHKGSKPRWDKYQPILHPTSPDLETRLLYDAGYYIPARISDIEAKNLKDLVFLNDFGFPEARIAYINSLKDLFGTDLVKMKAHLTKYPQMVKFRRALETEFGIVL